jgi:hypothetical protein
MFGHGRRNKIPNEGYYLENGIGKFDIWWGAIAENELLTLGWKWPWNFNVMNEFYWLIK